jgi:uncharacterized membrane protein
VVADVSTKREATSSSIAAAVAVILIIAFLFNVLADCTKKAKGMSKL